MEIKFELFDDEERKKVRKLLDMIDNIPVAIKQTILEPDNEKATPKQIGYLRKLGYQGDPSKLSVKEASKEIERLGG